MDSLQQLGPKRKRFNNNGEGMCCFLGSACLLRKRHKRMKVCTRRGCIVRAGRRAESWLGRHPRGGERLFFVYTSRLTCSSDSPLLYTTLNQRVKRGTLIQMARALFNCLFMLGLPLDLLDASETFYNSTTTISRTVSSMCVYPALQ